MDQDADAPPSAKRTRKLDLVNDPQWARLVGVFNLSSPKDLSSLSLEVLRNKAFELQLADMNITKKPKKPTSFNSYLAACEAIIGSLPTASTTQQHSQRTWSSQQTTMAMLRAVQRQRRR